MNTLKQIKIKYIIYLIIIFSIAYNQDIFENNIYLEKNNQNNNILLNPNNFSINQSLGFSMSTINGLSQSSTILTNKIKYDVTDKLFIKSNIHLVSPIQNQFNGNTVNILYDIDLGYDISNSFNLHFRMTNYHPLNLNYHSIYE